MNKREYLQQALLNSMPGSLTIESAMKNAIKAYDAVEEECPVLTKRGPGQHHGFDELVCCCGTMIEGAFCPLHGYAKGGPTLQWTPEERAALKKQWEDQPIEFNRAPCVPPTHPGYPLKKTKGAK